jgi:hypothetical protein
MVEINSTHVPVTYEYCEHIDGPFYHGTKVALEAVALPPDGGHLVSEDVHHGKTASGVHS